MNWPNRTALATASLVSGLALAGVAAGQLIDRTKAPNVAGEGINKSLAQQIGAGRGDELTPLSSLYIISRDPFRAISRGQKLFQRKWSQEEGQGPGVGDSRGDVNTVLAIGAGIADSCASCHGRPRGAAGFGGDVATRPDSRDAPHLFGLGLKEMLADEMTAELRSIRSHAIAAARRQGRTVTMALTSKGIAFGSIAARANGMVDLSQLEGVEPDLRVRPFFHHGGEFSIRSFVVQALRDEMGLLAADPDLVRAASGQRVTTPSGLVLDGTLDRVAAPAGGGPEEIPESLVDFLEFYLMNYFKPGTGEQTAFTRQGRHLLEQIGCARCHVPDLAIARDRRVADVETVFDPTRGIFNRLFASAEPLLAQVEDHAGHPPRRPPLLGPFLVRDIFTDLKLHDLGPAFHERNYDGTMRTRFLTTPLWGVGNTPPYGHDGRSINLTEVILRHGGEAQAERDAFAALGPPEQGAILDFLNSLIVFGPPDTASNLEPGDPQAPGFPQFKHGSINLTVLFNDPGDKE
jgi:hypothetical protein